jgi:hypothetical protein
MGSSLVDHAHVGDNPYDGKHSVVPARSRNDRVSGDLAAAYDHPFVKYTNCITAASREYGRQQTMDDACHAGEDHFGPETRRGDQMLQIRFTDRRGVVNEYPSEESHGNASSGIRKP